MVPDLEDADEDRGWINQLGLENSSMGTLYLRGVEFSLMIMVMGYSTAKPDTDLERGVAIMCMIIAGSAYAYVIGAVCSVVSERDPVAIQYQVNKYIIFISQLLFNCLSTVGYQRHCERLLVDSSGQQTMDLLRSFMDENHLPMQLRWKMQGWCKGKVQG